MARPLFLMIFIVLTIIFPVQSAVAASPFDLDPFGSDPDGLCHAPGAIDQEALYKVRAASVFSVLITNGKGLEPKGTATLVDDENGLFLTAAHVVHFYQDSPIWVSHHGDRADNKQYRVHIFPLQASTADWATEDLALLQAENWDKPPQFQPFPLRIDAVDEFIKGFFIGHAEDQESSIFGEFNVAFGDANSERAMTFSGTAFPHSSGATLLDGRGRAFGLVVRDGDLNNGPVGGLTAIQLRRILWNNNHFSAFPLRLALSKLKAMPPSSSARDLLNDLNIYGPTSIRFMSGLQRKPMTSIDTIHLTDNLLSAPVWAGLPKEAHADLIVRMFPIVARACTHRYWADALAGMYKNAALNPGGDKPKTQSQSLFQKRTIFAADELSGLLAKVQERSSAGSAEDIGTLFLHLALTDYETRPEASALNARFAEAFLRKAAEENGLLTGFSALQNPGRSALIGNLAIAEDLIGNTVASREAIFLADYMGGSVAAYRLAARYAEAEGDVSAAAGLYARGYSLLQGSDPRTQRSRDLLQGEFSKLAARSSVLAGSTPADYRLPFSADLNVSRWYNLASNNTAATMSELAVRLFEAGDDYQSELLLRNALSLNEVVFGPNHPQIAIDLQNLAAVLMPTSRYERGQAFVDRALEINLRSFGEASREAAVTHHNKGVLYREERNYSKAKSEFLTAVEITRRASGRDAQTAFHLQYVGSASALQREWSAAEGFYQEACALLRGLPTELAGLATCLYNVGILQIEQGRFDEAILSISNALDVNRAGSADRSLDLVGLKVLAALHFRSNNVDEARRYAEMVRGIDPEEFVIRNDPFFFPLPAVKILPLPPGKVLSIDEWLRSTRATLVRWEQLRRPPLFEQSSGNINRPQLYPLR